MLIVMQNDATDRDVRGVVERIEAMGYRGVPMKGSLRIAVGVVGNEGPVDGARFMGLPGVREVVPVTRPYKLVSREWQPHQTIVDIGAGVTFGGKTIPVIAGPCSVESETQLLEAAHAVRESGGTVLRGGAYKPRTSPYSFQGLGTAGLKILARARQETGLRIVTEAIDPESVDVVAEYADLIQVGARSMQNFSLLKRVGQSGKPVLLKRGLAATINELLLSAEYVMAEGNSAVILCERGIRGFDSATRNVFDLTAMPALHQLSHLPVVADPSHGTGVRDYVAPMTLAALAAGADGVMIEVHPDPSAALSDGAQSLPTGDLPQLIEQMRAVARAVNREVAALAPAQEVVGA
ncbi:MAG: 3-deoxy-7-phosphoheptulonate synthase [Gemmatimonadales bacterium]